MKITIFFNKDYSEQETYNDVINWIQGNYLIVEIYNRQDKTRLGKIYKLEDIKKYFIEE